MSGVESLQKALDKIEFTYFDQKDVATYPTMDGRTEKQFKRFLKLFSTFKADYDKQTAKLASAEEKNVEYAKLVAGQAKEYAEKLRDKVLVDRKQLSDFHDKFIRILKEFAEDEEDIMLVGSIEYEFERFFGEAFSQKGSGEPLNLTLAFTDVKKKKSFVKDGKEESK